MKSKPTLDLDKIARGLGAERGGARCAPPAGTSAPFNSRPRSRRGSRPLRAADEGRIPVGR